MDLRVQLAWTLLALLVLIPVIIAVTRMVGGRVGRVRVGKGALKVLAVLPLAPQRSVYVVDVGVRLLVLGATASDVRLLTEIEDAEEVERLRTLLRGGTFDGNPPAGGGGMGRMSFESLLGELRARTGKPRD